MEEEIHYSIVFSKTGGPPPEEKKEEPTIYSEVKHKGPATTAAPEKKEEPTIYSEVKHEGPATAAPEADSGAAAHSHSRVLVVFLGIISVVLVVSISIIIYISVVMNRQKANLRDLTAENEKLFTENEKLVTENETLFTENEKLVTENKKLVTERGILEQQTEELTRVTDNLNWTLGVILKFNTFPVNKYCPERKCQPCLKDWIPFQEKCYFFSKHPWKSWGKSREDCKAHTADLVVINSLQEQEFISSHIEDYDDIFHGYWMGLHETSDKDWFWIDGREDTLRYWIEGGRGKPAPYAQVMADTNLTASWDQANHDMRNRFICESDVLIKSN